MRRAGAEARLSLAAGMVLGVFFVAAAQPVMLGPPCGTPTIADRACFEFYSQLANFPGAMQVREVKFLIAGVDTAAPELYFQNTTNHPLHYDFTVDCLGWDLDLETFNRQTYFSDQRRNLAGSIIAHDHYEPNDAIGGIYTMEFWPTDPVAFDQVELAYGVAVTKNIYNADWPGYYVNVQVGENLVTNPPAYATPDEFLVADLAGLERYEIQYVRWSNLVADGHPIMTKGQIFQLADYDGPDTKTLQTALRHPAGGHGFRHGHRVQDHRRRSPQYQTGASLDRLRRDRAGARRTRCAANRPGFVGWMGVSACPVGGDEV